MEVFNVKLDFIKYIPLFAYVVLCLFKQPVGDQNHIITITIGVIPLLAYSIVESILLIVLLCMKLWALSEQLKNGKRIISFIIVVSLTFVIVGFNIKFWVSGTYSMIPGLLRPLYLTFYALKAFRLVYKCLRIFYMGFIYYAIMWFFIVVFSSLGIFSFKPLNLNSGTFQSFQNLWNAVFEILLYHCTARYPDLELLYMSYNKYTIIYFIVYGLINIMLMSCIITAMNFINYRTTLQQQYYEYSFFEILFIIVQKKLVASQRHEQEKILSQNQKWIIETIESKSYEFVVWITHLIIFFVICFINTEDAHLSQSVILFLLNLYVLVESLLKIYLLSFNLWKYSDFNIYQIGSSVLSIVLFFVAVSNSISYYQFLILVVLRIPRMLYLFHQYMVFVSKTSFPLIKKIQEITLILGMIGFYFAAAGEYAFGGVIIQSRGAELSDPNYVFLNFNNMINSLLMLFSLCIANNVNTITLTTINLYGNTSPRVYFILWFTLGVQLCYRLLLFLVIDYILLEGGKKDEQLALEVNVKDKEVLHDQESIIRVRRLIIAALKQQYTKNKTTEVYLYETKLRFHLHKALDEMQKMVKTQNNIFTVAFYNKKSEFITCAVQALRTLWTDEQDCKVSQINSMILNIPDIQYNNKWTTINAKDLFVEKGFTFKSYTDLNHMVLHALELLGLEPEYQKGHIGLLASTYLYEKNYKVPVYLKYDFPDQVCPNICELYYNNECIASSLKCTIDGKLYISEKIKINRLVKFLCSIETKIIPQEYFDMSSADNSRVNIFNYAS